MKMVFEAIKDVTIVAVKSPYFWAIFICIFVVIPSSVGLQYHFSKKDFIISLIFFLLGLAYLIVFFILNTLGVWLI
jgi:uncharacterized membrane protein YqaE (UPF0057 family)